MLKQCCLLLKYVNVFLVFCFFCFGLVSILRLQPKPFCVRLCVSCAVQYVQIKTVLKNKFDEFNDLLNDSVYTKDVGFDVNLPSVQFDQKTNTSAERDERLSTINECAANDTKLASIIVNIDSNDFPVSLIAQKLHSDNDILCAFKSLYLKYIDEKKAPFMINISSQNRKQLKISLDDDYFVQNCELANWSRKSLLLRLITEMDQAAFEVSELMLGSFARFQSSIKKQG